MQLSASFVGRRGDRVELSLILSAEQETLVEAVSVDDCGLVDDDGRAQKRAQNHHGSRSNRQR